MSTKSTIKYGDDFHFYQECFDEERVYLEINKAYFEAAPDRIVVGIPVEIWEVIRESGSFVSFEFADMTDEDIKRYCYSKIAERREKYERSEKGSLIRVLMSVNDAFGPIDTNIETQVKKGIKYYKALRNKQQVMRNIINGYREKNK